MSLIIVQFALFQNSRTYNLIYWGTHTYFSEFSCLLEVESMLRQDCIFSYFLFQIVVSSMKTGLLWWMKSVLVWFLPWQLVRLSLKCYHSRKRRTVISKWNFILECYICFWLWETSLMCSSLMWRICVRCTFRVNASLCYELMNCYNTGSVLPTVQKPFTEVF